MNEPAVVLHEGRHVALERLHPWIFSGAVARVEGDPETGETVAVRTPTGRTLALGAYSPDSKIRVRVWTFRNGAPVDTDLLRRRLERAIGERLPHSRTDDVGGRGVRLVNGESDGLPGLIVDRYADVTVCQFLSAGADRWREILVDLLQDLAPARSVFERSDDSARVKEGLSEVRGLLAGEEPPERTSIHEGGHRFHVDVRKGHGTGFYLDRREGRELLAEYAEDADVLDAFAYTGASGVVAAGAGARSLVSVDLSEEFLEEGRQHLKVNGLDHLGHEAIQGDASDVLRSLRAEGRRFDLIVLDPPPFVHARNQVRRGARGYKDVNLQAFQLLRSGGVLFTFSSSGHVDDALFAKIVGDAAADAKRPAQILHRLGAAVDHPVALGFPEGRYLTGLVCRATTSLTQPS